MGAVEKEKCDVREKNQQNKKWHHTSGPHESAHEGTKSSQVYLGNRTSCDPDIMVASATTEECTPYNST